MNFPALVLEDDPQSHDNPWRLKTLSRSDLPEQGGSLVRVLYSSLNYKDGLAVSGKGKIVRGSFPFVPGIDLVGEVVETTGDRFEPGSLVIGTGWGIGENHWGGYSGYQFLNDDWLVDLPNGLDPFQAMVAGTAGLTAMLSVMEIEARAPSAGAIAVTGATGGVGSLSVAFLSRLGYEVVASTGKSEATPYLADLGATEVIARQELSAGATRPLDSARFVGAVDSVGGTTLETLLSVTGRHGVIASCGLAGGASFSSTVFPFILRGVALVGIDSNTCPRKTRERAWRRIGEALDDALVDRIGRKEPLAEVPRLAGEIVSGRVMGRIVIDVAGASVS